MYGFSLFFFTKYYFCHHSIKIFTKHGMMWQRIHNILSEYLSSWENLFMPYSLSLCNIFYACICLQLSCINVWEVNHVCTVTFLCFCQFNRCFAVYLCLMCTDRSFVLLQLIFICFLPLLSHICPLSEKLLLFLLNSWIGHLVQVIGSILTVIAYLSQLVPRRFSGGANLLIDVHFAR